MVRSAFILLWFGVHLTMAQGPRIITETEITPRRGYVGEPRLLSVTVLSETYFTAPVSITNLKVEGAFLVPRQNTSTTVRRNGETYAGVIVKFYLFPYEDGTLEVPSVTFVTLSPPPGDYRATDVRVTTKATSFDVSAVPPTASTDQWIVADNLSVSERFDRSLDNLKVGDVITRTLTFTASNTLSEFIPEIEWPLIEGVSVYPQQPQLSNDITKELISGRRVERLSYLLEDSGSVVLPEVQMQFYHPGRRAFVNREVPARTIDVATNGDLSLVASVKDSLAAYLAVQGQGAKSNRSLPTITRKQMVLVVLLLAALWSLRRWRLIARLRAYIHQSQLAYRQSESYHYRQLVHRARRGSPEVVIRAIYRYLDEVRPTGYDHTLRSVVEGTPLEREIEGINNYLYDSGKNPSLAGLRNHLKALRPRHKTRIEKMVLPYLNP